MLKNIIILPDGTELSSGVVGKDAIMSLTLTENVNNGEEITIGSTCAGMIEVTVWNPGGRLTLQADEEITLYTETEDGGRTQVGIFIVEKPTRIGENSIKITGYDRIVKLDKDLSEWIISLKKKANTQYTVFDLVEMIEEQCGVNFIFANGVGESNFVRVGIEELPIDGVTGRILVQWIGEFIGAFCYANQDGTLVFDRYYESDVILKPSGQNHYYNNGLQYEDYEVSEIDAVQLRIADEKNGYLWPPAEAKNPYIITGNPLFNSLWDDRIKYGNTLLPKIPEWDTTKYPYAYISDGGSVYSLTVYSEKLWVSETGGLEPADGSYNYEYCEYVLAKREEDVERLEGLWPGINVNEWTLHEENKTGHRVPLYTSIWTNTDIYKYDGTLYLAATEPSEPDSYDVIKNQLSNIKERILNGTYTPCSVTIPAELYRNYAKYRGIELPVLPERDAEKYPYAHLQQVLFSDNYAVYFTDRPLTYGPYTNGDITLDGVYQIAVAPGESVTYLVAECVNDQWQELEEYGRDNTSGTEEQIISFILLKWSNHDILNEDGSVHLAGTNPTPYSKRVPRAIKAGQRFRVVDRNGVEFETLCMKRVQKGQRVTLSCTGGPLRSNATSSNNTKVSVPQKSLTQADVFSILTNGGEIDGLYMKDGQLYVNASYILGGNLDISGLTFGGLSLSWYELEDGTKVLSGK